MLGLVFLDPKQGLILEYPHIEGTGPPVNYLHLVTFSAIYQEHLVLISKHPKSLT